MAALIEISDVARARPAAGAGPTVLAAWYRRKAALLRDLGAEYAAAAERAESRARDLEVERVVA